VTPIGPNPALVPPGLAGVAPAPPAAPPAPPKTGPPARAFSDVLADEAAGLRISGHAAARLQKRGIELDQSTLQRLEGGVDRAAAKGSRESVVFVDDKAFVVAVRNRTVITAVDSAHMREHVFTNIDSAVIA
jgi:flagellar operon protein